MSNSMRLGSLAFAFAALLASMPVLAVKPSQPPAPATPAPLAVYDATGVNVGRYMGYLGTDPTQKMMWMVISVSGTPVSVPFGVPSGDTSQRMRWFPAWGTVYYAASGCSGPPLITAIEPAEAYGGFRRSITHASGTVKLYVAIDAAPTDQISQSYSYATSCTASGCVHSGCYSVTRTVKAWAVESEVDLDVTYPAPLTIR